MRLSIGETVGGILAHGITVSSELSIVKEPIDKARTSRALDCFGRGIVHIFDHWRFRTCKAIEFSTIKTERGGFQIETVQFADGRD